MGVHHVVDTHSRVYSVVAAIDSPSRTTLLTHDGPGRLGIGCPKAGECAEVDFEPGVHPDIGQGISVVIVSSFHLVDDPGHEAPSDGRIFELVPAGAHGDVETLPVCLVIDRGPVGCCVVHAGNTFRL